MTEQKKQTVEEAVLSQSLADIERASDRPMQAAAMDAAALETLDPMTHATALSRSAAVAKWPLPTAKANLALSTRCARSRTW